LEISKNWRCIEPIRRAPERRLIELEHAMMQSRLPPHRRLIGLNVALGFSGLLWFRIITALVHLLLLPRL
jgi:hypothetical protein